MDSTYIYRLVGLPLPSPSEWTAYHDDPADLLAASAGSACVKNLITAWITNE